MHKLPILLLLPFLLILPWPAQAQEGKTIYKELTISNSQSVPYSIHLPEGFDVSKTYPVLIGPGDATEGSDPGFYWATDPYSHGWIIVDAHIWERPTTEHLDALLDEVLSEYNVEGGKFHTVCWSANSAGIFRLATAHANRFHSITGMAGNPGRMSDRDVEALKDVRVQFVVGSTDTYWLRSAKNAHERLVEGGVKSELEVVDGEEHVMRSLIGKGFMDRMQRMR